MTASQLIPVVPGTIGNVQCLTVDGRTLHGVLGVRRDFSNWIKGRISKYGFIESQDFEVFAKTGENSEGGRPSQEYTCTLDMGKELCMVENNEKGRIARRYFIECERRLLSAEPVENPDKLPSLSPSHRSELKGIVDAKLSTYPASVQGKARSEIWTRFNRHFRIAEYAQLPAERMAEARDYLIELEVKALKALPTATPALSPAPEFAFRTDFPTDMHTGRKDALRKIQSLMAGVGAARDVVRLFCHPGGKSMRMTLDEREIYDALYQLYCAADDSLLAAYRALDAGYKIGKQYGRG